MAKWLVGTWAVRRILTSDLLFKLCFRRGLFVFLFHEVSDRPSPFNHEHNLNITPGQFKDQIETIKDLFTVISPETLETSRFSTPAAMITFDDGMEGTFTNALPILEAQECPSLIFMNMGPVDGDIFWSGLIVYLCKHHPDFVEGLKQRLGGQVGAQLFLQCTKDFVHEYLESQDRDEIYRKVRAYYGSFSKREDLEKAQKSQLVSIGNHLYNHYNCQTLDDKSLEEAYEQNESAMEPYRNKVPMFSYPFGQPQTCYSQRTNQVIKKMGARYIFSAHSAINFKRTSKFLYRLPIEPHIKTKDDFKMMFIKVAFRQLFDRRYLQHETNL